MNLLFPPEQQHWLEAQVAAGLFPSVEAAAQAAVATAMLDQARLETDNLQWAKPFVDQGLADMKNGRVLSRAEHKARMEERMKSLIDTAI